MRFARLSSQASSGPVESTSKAELRTRCHGREPFVAASQGQGNLGSKLPVVSTIVGKIV